MSNFKNIDVLLAGIGVNVESEKRGSVTHADIEETLILAAQEVLARSGTRTLSLILSWISVHGERVNMERLVKLSKESLKTGESSWLRLFASFGHSKGQSRWKILMKQRPETPLANGPLRLVRSQIKRSGEESWSEGTGFLIPKGSEPVAEKYVLSPAQLATINTQYRNRLIFGSSWRADIATAIEGGAASPTEAAKMSGSSYEPAYRVYKELEISEYFKTA